MSTNARLMNTGARVVEWYVNKAEGIEQGFTLDDRPWRGAGVPDSEPLRLAVSLEGDLRARAAQDGQSVELRERDAGVLSYSKLIAFDATGRKARGSNGDELRGRRDYALMVEDATAQYPIVVDPITATQKQELDAGLDTQQDARFGFSVAIDDNLAVVGAWREDMFGPPN